MKDILNDTKKPTAPVFKVKHVVIVFIFGWILISMGSLLKIKGWANASELMFLGSLFNVLGLILAIVKLILIKDLHSIFNK